MIKIYLLIIFTLSLKLHAIEIDDVNFVCKEGACQWSKRLLEDLKSKDLTHKEIKSLINYHLIDSNAASVNFKVLNHEGKNTLVVSGKDQKKIYNINFFFTENIKIEGVASKFLLKAGDYFNEELISDSVKSVLSYLKSLGYVNANVLFSKKDFKSGYVLNVNIDLGSILSIGKINIQTDFGDTEKFVKKLVKFQGRPWNPVMFNLELDKISKDLFERGYFFSKVKINKTNIRKSARKVDLSVNVELGKVFNFNFRGNDHLHRFLIVEKIQKVVKANSNRMSHDLITNIIVKLYEEKGFFNTKVKIREISGFTKFKIPFVTFFVSIQMGTKVTINNVNYYGVRYFDKSFFNKLLKLNTSPLVSSNYLDKLFFTQFKNTVKKEYLKNGFVFSEVEGPFFTKSKVIKSYDVSYKVREKNQIILSHINLGLSDSKLENEILSKMTNKKGRPLNIVQVESDLDKIEKICKDRGYFFASIKNKNSEKLINYQLDGNTAQLNINIDLQKKFFLNDIRISGYKKTKLEVIERELDLSKGDLITPDLIKDTESRLINLSLFNYVRITPFIINRNSKSDSYKINLIIQLKEKDYGVIRVAPGYRTDLGFKLSSSLLLQNLFGLSHSANFVGQVNRRTNFSAIDIRRRNVNRSMIEMNGKIKYIWPHFLIDRLNFESSVSLNRRRFFSFDAEIFQSNFIFSRDFFNNLSLSVKYQLEAIKQFDAINDEDNGFFRIGGFTPGLSIDFRDNPISPRKGFFLGLTYEFANPSLLSLDRNDLVIDFYKIVSRNRFYFSFDDFVIASSISVGKIQNKSRDILYNANGNPVVDSKNEIQTKGFIPSIKIFRLDGIDRVRGYADDEINRLDSGIDISDVIVKDSAYFANLKLEPRYYYNDNLIFNCFLDAGRVYVDSFKPGNLRTSVGLGIKYLTPVGTIDFDYGVKLKQRTDAAGNEERFGRFHVSIGSF